MSLLRINTLHLGNDSKICAISHDTHGMRWAELRRKTENTGSNAVKVCTLFRVSSRTGMEKRRRAAMTLIHQQSLLSHNGDPLSDFNSSHYEIQRVFCK